MLFKTCTGLVAALLALTLQSAPVAAGKPTVNPDFPGGLNGLAKPLKDNLPAARSSWDPWGTGWIPQVCKGAAQSHGWPASDLQVFNVHYDDCDEPWTFCRHKKAKASRYQMINTFGRLPAGMRQYVCHMMAFPDSNDWAAKSYDDVYSFGGKIDDLTVLVRFFGWILDNHAFNPSYGTPFSKSQQFKTAYDTDSAVPGSDNSMSDVFNDVVLAALATKVLPGGLSSILPNNGQIVNQVWTVLGLIKQEVFTKGGRCTARLTQSPPVPMADASRRSTDRLERRLGSKPDTEFKSGIAIMPDTPEDKLVEKVSSLSSL